MYTKRTDNKQTYSNTEIIEILENVDEGKLSYVPPIKSKGGEVYVLDWHGGKSKIKDYVANQYVWVADSTKTTKHSGKDLHKKYFSIHDDPGLVHYKKWPHSKDFRKTVSYIKDNPFLQVIEYIGKETIYKWRPHGNTKDNSAPEFHRTAPSVMEKINDKLTSGRSVSSTYTNTSKENEGK